ncbi:hypothetical protein T439DRAFT_90486 [Meredithblackwellia eburnea MCA 4105]
MSRPAVGNDPHPGATTKLTTPNIGPFPQEVNGVLKCFCGHQTTGRARRPLMERHRLTHSGVKPYKCRVCGKDFPRTDTRAVHEKRTHPGSAEINNALEMSQPVADPRPTAPTVQNTVGSISSSTNALSRVTFQQPVTTVPAPRPPPNPIPSLAALPQPPAPQPQQQRGTHPNLHEGCEPVNSENPLARRCPFTAGPRRVSNVPAPRQSTTRSTPASSSLAASSAPATQKKTFWNVLK